MSYFDINPIIPPYPNDPFVNEQSQLNPIWDELDSKLGFYTNLPTSLPLNPEIGQEAVGFGGFAPSEGAFYVWNGTSWIQSQYIESGWNSWTDVANIGVNETGNHFQYRVNSLIRRVELAGAIEYTGPAAWPTTEVYVSPNGSFGIPSTYIPIGNRAVFQTAGGTSVSNPPAVNGAHVVIQGNGSSPLNVRVTYLGPSTGTSRVRFDGIGWFY